MNNAVSQAATNYEVLTLETLAKDLSEVFTEANERFDKNRFLSACGFKNQS